MCSCWAWLTRTARSSPPRSAPVAEACGQTPEQVRSCLRRLVAEGLFIRDGGAGKRRQLPRHRQRAWPRSADGRAHAAGLRPGRRRARAGTGKWRLVAFAVPEPKRAPRDSFRDHLMTLGGAAIQGGLYVSPHRWHKDVAGEAERLGVADVVTQRPPTTSTSVASTMHARDRRRLWPVEELAERYRRFIEHYAFAAGPTGGPAAPPRAPARRGVPARRPGDGRRVRRLLRRRPAAAARAAPPALARTGRPRARRCAAAGSLSPPEQAGPAPLCSACSTTRSNPFPRRVCRTHEVRHLLRAPAAPPLGGRTASTSC